MTIFLITLGIYITALIYLNIKVNPNNKQLPARLEVLRKSMTSIGKLIFLILLSLAFTAIWLTVQYLLHLLGYAEHPFPQ
jgi:hypothetical protein